MRGGGGLFPRRATPSAGTEQSRSFRTLPGRRKLPSQTPFPREPQNAALRQDEGGAEDGHGGVGGQTWRRREGQDSPGRQSAERRRQPSRESRWEQVTENRQG